MAFVVPKREDSPVASSVAQPLFAPLEAKERSMIALAAGVYVFLTCLPLLYGWWFAQQHNLVFLAYSSQSPSDSNVYFAWMEQVRTTGHVFVRNVFSPDAQLQALFSPLWAVLGYLAGIFRLSVPFVFHVARAFAGFCFLVFAYRGFSVFLPTVSHRRLALALLVFGGGFGLAALPFVDYTNIQGFLSTFSADLWLVDGFTYLAMSQSSQFILANILVFFTFTLVVIDTQCPGRVPLHIFSALAALLAVIHPYDLVQALPVIAVFSIVHWRVMATSQPLITQRSVKRLLVMGCTVLPIVLYYAASTYLDPAMRGWAKQSILHLPSVSNLLVALGLLLPLSLGGLWVIRKQRSIVALFLSTWVITQCAVLALPLQMQRRFSTGLHIVIVILASFALVKLMQWLRKKINFFYLGVAIFLALALSQTPLYALVKDYVLLSDSTSSNYVQPSVLKAMNWLAMQPTGVTFSTPQMSEMIVSRTQRLTYYAHWGQTTNRVARLADIESSFTEGDPEKIISFFQRNSIRYVFWSPAEQEVFGMHDLHSVPRIKVVYLHDGIIIYQVNTVASLNMYTTP